MSSEEIYLYLWICLAIVMVSFSILVVYRAVKNRKSPGNSHANILALISEIPEKEGKLEIDKENGNRERNYSS